MKEIEKIKEWLQTNFNCTVQYLKSHIDNPEHEVYDIFFIINPNSNFAWFLLPIN